MTSEIFDFYQSENQVWLKEIPNNQIIALVYKDDKKEILLDITSFRPDPRDYLKSDTIYNAKIKFKLENDYDGRPEKIPIFFDIELGKKSVGRVKFVRIR